MKFIDKWIDNGIEYRIKHTLEQIAQVKGRQKELRLVYTDLHNWAVALCGGKHNIEKAYEDMREVINLKLGELRTELCELRGE